MVEPLVTSHPIVSLHRVEQWHPANDDSVSYEICECRHAEQSLGYALLLGKLRLNLLTDASFHIEGDGPTALKTPFKDNELSDAKVNCYSSVAKAQAAAQQHHKKFGTATERAT